MQFPDNHSFIFRRPSDESALRPYEKRLGEGIRSFISELYLVNGGVEFRVHKWIGLSVDAQYTHVPDILGQGGVSKEAGETDLGGIAARFKVIVGR